MLGSVGERYTPATPDEIAALDARLRKRGVQFWTLSCLAGRKGPLKEDCLRFNDVYMLMNGQSQ